LNQGERVTAWKIQGVKVDVFESGFIAAYLLMTKHAIDKITISKIMQVELIMMWSEFLKKLVRAQSSIGWSESELFSLLDRA
jgi:hypothetical protein